MELAKNVIYTACLCAVLTSIVKIFSSSSMKNQLQLVCTLVLIICVAAQITHSKINISSDELSLAEDNYSQLSEQYEQSVIEQTRTSLESRLYEELFSVGIDANEISIVCTLDEYNGVVAESACVYLSSSIYDEQCDAARKTAENLLGCEVEVVQI
ncbi:MAG: hypothetical protein LUI06_01680 [Ruminococcus sp.]|nr:hypothetical protein [Ruminococcus sp.]